MSADREALMTETIDKSSGIVRHEISTVTPGACRKQIEGSGYIRKRYAGNNVVRYIAEYKGTEIEIRSSQTRAVLFSLNRYALMEFEKAIKADGWEYDNTTAVTDYMQTKK